jgi:uncharacterized protein (TIGR04255 family)
MGRSLEWEAELPFVLALSLAGAEQPGSMNIMIAQRHYRKPPVTEAIVDLRVELPPEISLTELKKAHVGEEAAYPIAEQRHVAFGQMQIGPQVSATAGRHQIGYLFRSRDGNQIYQARLDGFAITSRSYRRELYA